MSRNFNFNFAAILGQLKPKKNDRHAAARIAIGVLLVLNLVAGWFVYSPIGGSAEEMEANLIRLREQVSKKQEVLQRGKQLAAKVDKGRTQVSSTGFTDPYWNSWYGYPRYGAYGRRRGYYSPYYPRGAWGFGWNDPWFNQGYETTTVFVSAVSLKIDRRADGNRLFEGKAEAASTSNRLGYLVPNLVEAMFSDFPGNSGETVRISVAPEKKNKN